MPARVVLQDFTGVPAVVDLAAMRSAVGRIGGDVTKIATELAGLNKTIAAFVVAVHARFARELATRPPGVEVIVFSGGGDPAADYRDFSAVGELIEAGRHEVAAVLDRYRGTSHQLSVR